ncbi:MAG: Rid family detoxifying hydrolase [Oscillospiraceae bacterium]|nr:Rid family detoxifying hydrolase [Oscillospiraceae bacterium]
MANKSIISSNAPAAVGPYVHAVEVSAAQKTVYVSGQLGLVPATGVLPEGVEAQAEQALTNLTAVLAAAGLSLADVVKTTVFLADIADFGAINDIYARYFGANKPARSCVAVKTLPKAALFEIEAVAAQ